MRRFHALALELVLIALASVAALVLRDNFEVTGDRWIAFLPYLCFTLVASAAAFPLLGTHRAVWRYTTMVDSLRVAAATTAALIGAVALGFSYNRMEGLPRALPILQALLILFSLGGVRILLRLWRTARERAPADAEPAKVRVSDRKTVLVVGVDGLTDLYLRAVARFAADHVRVAGLLAENDRHVGRVIQGRTILGTPEQVRDVLHDLEVHGVFVDSVVVATDFEKLSEEARAALVEIESGSDIKLEFLADQMGLALRAPISAEPQDGAAAGEAFLVDVDGPNSPVRRPIWRIKRAADCIVGTAMLIAAAPLMVLVAMLVAIDVGLPLTFWQQRPGLNGRPFKVHKFRTMAAAHDARGNRVPDEKRMSGIGSFLRKTRLDELPQLLNIIFGEMSFVGPRPLLPVDQPAEYAARLLVRPGLTGWAQVKGGRTISAADKAALDVWYVWNASAALDFVILLRTVQMVLFGERVDDDAIRRAWGDLREAGVHAPEEFSA